MDVTILGSGTAIPDGTRGSPGIAVRADDVLILLDVGSGSLYRAARFGIPLERVDGVLLSHFHPDHTGDLVPLLFAFRNPEFARDRPLVLVGPAGLRSLVAKLEAAYGSWIEAIGYERCCVEIAAEALLLDGVRVRACPVQHGPSAVAYEITDRSGRRVVFGGDTEYCEALGRFARDADLLILECSFPEGTECRGHLTPSQAGRLAVEARCARLVLTHFYPACQGQDLLTPCRAVYSGPVTLAEDGMRVSLPAG